MPRFVAARPASRLCDDAVSLSQKTADDDFAATRLLPLLRGRILALLGQVFYGCHYRQSMYSKPHYHESMQPIINPCLAKLFIRLCFYSHQRMMRTARMPFSGTTP